MNTLMSGLALLLAVMVSGSVAWPYDEDYSAWRLARSIRRSHPQCAGVGSRCYSTVDCCHGFVCAAFDDYYGRGASEGSDPETPGFCVKEKDLEPCMNSRDCNGGYACVELGRNGENYCVQGARANLLQREQQVLQQVMNGPESSYQMAARGSGNAGSNCQSTSECRAMDKSGNALCCQKISRGRKGVAKVCERVTELSKCLN